MDLDWEYLANIGEFLGGVGVLLSLLYVAIQLRESNHSRSSETFGRTVDRMASMQQLLAQDREISRLYNQGLIDPQALCMTDRVRFTWVLTELFGGLEFMYIQARQGDIPKIIWQRWQQTMGWWLTFPGVRAWWECKPTPFTDDFSELVRTCIEQEETFSAPSEWWCFLQPGPNRSSSQSPSASRSIDAIQRR